MNDFRIYSRMSSAPDSGRFQCASQRVFKKAFSKKDKALPVKVAATLKDQSWWKMNKTTVRMGSPVIKSMRLCDSRKEAKAGLVAGAMFRMSQSVSKRSQSA